MGVSRFAPPLQNKIAKTQFSMTLVASTVSSREQSQARNAIELMLKKSNNLSFKSKFSLSTFLSASSHVIELNLTIVRSVNQLTVDHFIVEHFLF